ncbi:TIGR03503 family protein [Alteromonas sediminis]|uniref:TIGR03503 family protein n=1 Tax=Alteromonas sediminis TaxID=2259342 RepID=A0A3N5YDJ9_9ALTE|nr:TIGR03503 family protein [Alteromonas sediminis]RPJ67665.1 TIGR03503 family protein [Alteromonas sediminis]
MSLAQSEPDIETTTEPSPLEQLGSEYHNSIKLLSNRFRIDYEVEEVTMVFFRKYGSAPVVLVRPDGSKIFQINADGESVAWFDSETYDMISIKNPVPGPWQAVGQILPNSRVMVLSDIQLQADPLPPIIFSGEILKQTARLTNGGKLIDYGPFRDVVSLNIELSSTNNPNYDNFGAAAQEVARFEDNGRGMDERPLDGVFTGQFNLAIAAGEWKPVFRVTTPMFTREQIDPPIQLYPTPIYTDVELNGGGNNYHKLVIDVNRELVDINSLLIDGKVRFPNGDIQNFSLTEANAEPREHMIIAFEDGIFRIKLTAYGKTVNGRDFILDVPEFTFLAKSEEPEPEVVNPENTDDSNTVTATGDETSELVPTQSIDEAIEPTQNEPEEQESVVTLVLLVNGIILCFGIVVIVALMWRKHGAPAALKNIRFKLPRKEKDPVSE